MSKRATIEAQFVDIKGCPMVTSTAEASSAGAAISSAVRSLLKDHRLKKKRWQAIKATITVVSAADDSHSPTSEALTPGEVLPPQE